MARTKQVSDRNDCGCIEERKRRRGRTNSKRTPNEDIIVLAHDDGLININSWKIVCNNHIVFS